MPPAPAAPVTVPAPALELRDFSDRLPPVVVKELRQGLRTRMFIVPFLVLHALLLLCALNGARTSGTFFWNCLIIMLVALLPMRNIGALSEERQSRTLDTLLLTRLTPWRIVSGKWIATFGLTLLTAVSVLPYLLVRYLNDGTNFVLEGAVLAGLVFLSGALTGIFTSLSTLGSGMMGAGMLRHAAAVIILLVSYRFAAFALFDILAEGHAGAMMPVIAGAMWITTFCLWQAAATIAPAAANLTTPRRLTTLVAVTVTGLLLYLVPDAGGVGRNILLFILIMSTLVETSGRLVRNPVADAAFGRRGTAGHLAAMILYPGWATGVVFSILLWGGAALITGLAGGRMQALGLPVAYSFFPVCIAAPFFLRRFEGLALMILIAAVAHTFIALAAALLPGQLETLFKLVPTTDGKSFLPAMALAWAGLAFLFAVVPLFLLGNRISRESSL